MNHTVTELMQLQADGRLVVLPCKVGDVVWEINIYNLTVLDYKITHIYIDKSHIACERQGDYGFKGFYENEFGKTVFLTREEAEKALEEFNNG